MKRAVIIIVLAAVLATSGIIAGSCSNESGEPIAGNDVVYQVSTMGALMQGVYEGAVSYEELEKHGDFGLGTFEGLDGEMVGLDGVFYQVKTNGVPQPVTDSMTAPFVVVTFFETDRKKAVRDVGSMDELKSLLDGILPSKNIFYAVRLHGKFKSAKTRSVPGQSEPYPPLGDVIEKQTTFDLQDVSGTIVGFYFPDYTKEINVVGYHLHFITDDRKAGGHLLECAVESGYMEIDDSEELYMVLPHNRAFYNADQSVGE